MDLERNACQRQRWINSIHNFNIIFNIEIISNEKTSFAILNDLKEECLDARRTRKLDDATTN